VTNMLPRERAELLLAEHAAGSPIRVIAKTFGHSARAGPRLRARAQDPRTFSPRRAAPCRGWPAFGPGKRPPGPCHLAGVSVEVSRVKRDFAYTFARHFYRCSLSYGHSHA
jgi:hypothetical protein